MRDYFNEIGAPATLGDVGIPAGAIGNLIDSINLFPAGYRSLDRDDVRAILKLSV